LLQTWKHEHPVQRAAFRADGKTVLVATDQGIHFWDTATGKHTGEPLKGNDGFASFKVLAFDPDGAVALIDGIIKQPQPNEGHRLWRLRTGNPIGEPLSRDGSIRAAAFSPDGKTLVTVEIYESHLCRWETATGRPIGEPWPVRNNQVAALAFSPDGKAILAVGSGLSSGEFRLWDATTGKPVGEPMRSGYGFDAVALSPDTKTVLTAYKEVRLWDAATGKPLGGPLQQNTPVRAVAFRPDGKTFVTGSPIEGIHTWQAPVPLQGDAERLRLWI